MKFFSLQLILFFLSPACIQADTDWVEVDIWAKQFENGKPITDATVTDLYSGDQWVTNSDGMIRTRMEVGREVTFTFHKPGFPVIQNGLTRIPTEGLTGHQKEITFQVSAQWLYSALKALFPDPEKGYYDVITTLSAFDKNLRDDDGAAGLRIEVFDLDRGELIEDANIIYLGQFLGNAEFVLPALSQVPGFKWLARKNTSHDGGIIIRHIPQGHFEIRPYRPGSDDRGEFRTASFHIVANSPKLLNISPPHGPGVIKDRMKY